MTQHFPLLALSLALATVLPTQAPAQSGAETRYVKALLNQLQPRSFAENREYCGYIGTDASGQLKASAITRGTTDSCEPQWPDDLNVIASFHTHAGFDLEALSEWPSGTDMEGDEAEGIDGWVSTPGGRLWYIDTNDMVTSQICGLGCLAQDPKFRPGVNGQVQQSYTLRELQRLERN